MPRAHTACAATALGAPLSLQWGGAGLWQRCRQLQSREVRVPKQLPGWVSRSAGMG